MRSSGRSRAGRLGRSPAAPPRAGPGGIRASAGDAVPGRSDERKREWLGELAAVAVTRELRAAGVPAISRDDRLQAMERLRVPSVPLLSHATVVRLASVVGASTAIVGRIEATAGELVLRARTIRVDTGQMGDEVVERGPRAELFDVAARLGRRLVPAPARRVPTPVAARPPRGRVRALRPQPRHREPRHQADAADVGARAGAGVRRGALRAVAGVLRSGRAPARAHGGERRPCERSERAPRGVPRRRVRTPARTLSGSDGGPRRAASRPARRRGGQRHGRSCSCGAPAGTEGRRPVPRSHDARSRRRRPVLQSRLRALDCARVSAGGRRAARGRAARSGRRRRALRARRGAAGERRGRGGRAREGPRPAPVVGLQRARCQPQRQLGAARLERLKTELDAASRPRVETAHCGGRDSASNASWPASTWPTDAGCRRPAATPTRSSNCGAPCSCRPTTARRTC